MENIKEYTKKSYANPFNWVGSKHRYLKEFAEVLPWDKSKLDLKVLDPFVGGGDLISKLPSAWKVDANDLMCEVYNLHKAVHSGEINSSDILTDYNNRGMSKTNKEAFTSLRQEYNKTKDIKLLYLLMTNSFNNQLRFNMKGEFNMPFGKDRSHFSKNMQTKLDNYQLLLKGRDVNFYNKSYKDFEFSEYDLLLLDPPYSNTCATYNENTGWGYEEDIKLFEKIDSSGTDFIYFNQTWSKGVSNQVLIDWMQKYEVKVLKETSTGCNHQRKDGFTEEVMVYKISK